MGEYKKITKCDVDFPAYCLFFIKRILANIDESNMDEDTTMTLIITTPDHPYCYDALELVMRTLDRKGYNTRLPGFKRDKAEGKPDMFTYRWTIKKAKKCDDLPF